MPEVMLVSLLIGLVFLIVQMIREPRPLTKLLLAWLTFPVLRASLPGAVNFDGIRHFLEFVPAAAIISSIGVVELARWLRRYKIPAAGTQAFVALLWIASLVTIHLAYGPYLHIYYNSLTVGLSGARDHWLGGQAADYWGGSYRQGMIWISQNAPSDAIVYATPAEWLVTLSGPVFLRPDIQANPEISLPDFNQLEQSDRAVFVMFNYARDPIKMKWNTANSGKYRSFKFRWME